MIIWSWVANGQITSRDEHQISYHLTCSEENFAWMKTSSKQIDYQLTNEAFFKLAKEKFKIFNESSKYRTDNLNF
jgi:hypothetical protein